MFDQISVTCFILFSAPLIPESHTPECLPSRLLQLPGKRFNPRVHAMPFYVCQGLSAKPRRKAAVELIGLLCGTQDCDPVDQGEVASLQALSLKAAAFKVASHAAAVASERRLAGSVEQMSLAEGADCCNAHYVQ
jgi:hypothetical protein